MVGLDFRVDCGASQAEVTAAAVCCLEVLVMIFIASSGV